MYLRDTLRLPAPRQAQDRRRGFAPLHTLCSPIFDGSLPACLAYAWQEAFECHPAEADATQSEVPDVGPGPPAIVAPVVMPYLKTLRPFPALYFRYLGHSLLPVSGSVLRRAEPTTSCYATRESRVLAKGIPISSSSRKPCWSFGAVVTITTCSPLIRSMLL